MRSEEVKELANMVGDWFAEIKLEEKHREMILEEVIDFCRERKQNFNEDDFRSRVIFSEIVTNEENFKERKGLRDWQRDSLARGETNGE